ncbi:hypothetical protein B0H13DRAFT_1933002 [Mycena leptocephala]|nr:hypothetical protein B0H13DRAFT_1933002 [Mycena leptocephala]
MTSQSRSSQSQSPVAAASVMTAFAPTFMPICLLVVPIGMGMGAMTLPLAGMSFASTPAPAAVAPETAPAPARAPAPAVAKPGAGLPARLVALLRDEKGPFFANQVFSATPAQPLEAIEEDVPAPEWYAITQGRFVGVVSQYALSDVAITGVGASARKAYTTQALALEAFNQALVWGGVQVV